MYICIKSAPLNSHWSLPLLTGEGVGVEPYYSSRHEENMEKNPPKTVHFTTR